MRENLIGMEEIKEKVKEYEKFVKFISKSKEEGIQLPKMDMNIVFTGPIGVGKTSIANDIADILYKEKIIKNNKVVKVNRNDLVSVEPGKTTEITQKVIDNAEGSVIYIEDANLLYLDDNDISGLECTTTLIKNMEEKKGEIVFIFAGYEELMQDFVNINVDIRSRIAFTFNFPTYTTEELLEIFKYKINNMGLFLKKGVIKKVTKVINHFQIMKYFENGVFIDILIQQILIKHTKNYKENNIKMIITCDIPTIEEMINVVPDISVVDPENIPEEIMHRTAYHELGHAIVRKVLTDEHNIERITIKADADGDLGLVAFKFSESTRILPTEDELRNNISIYFAGMVAEKTFYGSHSGGCCSDYAAIKGTVSAMINDYCMKDFSLSDTDNANKIMKDAKEVAEKIVFAYKEVIEYIKVYLVMRQTISGEELDLLMEFYEQGVDIEDAIKILEAGIENLQIIEVEE